MSESPLPGPVTAIVLAAGESKRMGEPKLLLPFAGSTILENSLRHLVEGGVSEIVLVVGLESGLERIARSYSGAPIRIVRNPEPASGMLRSVQLGAEALATERDFMIALADQPTVPPALIRRLIDTFIRGRPEVLVPVFAGKRGHPLLFSHELRGPLLELGAGATLRDLVHAHPISELEVDTDDIHRDIDTRERYEEEVRRAGAGREAREC